MVRELPLWRYEHPDAIGIDLFQTRGGISGTGRELEFYIGSGKTNRYGSKSTEFICLHGRCYSRCEECGCGCNSRGFGEACRFLGKGEYGGFRFGRGALDRGRCFKVCTERSASGKKVQRDYSRPSGLRAWGEW